MYLKLFRASEAAVNILVEAQRECEEMYVNAPEPDIRVISINGNEIAQTGDEK